MQTIRAKSGKWGDLFFTIFRLWLDPDSIKSSQVTLQDAHGHVAYAVQQKFGADKVKLTAKDMRAVYKAEPRGMRLPGTYQSTVGQGMIAGAILWNVLRIADQVGSVASLELGLRLTGAMLAKEGAAHGRSMMLAAWSRYRGVSHYFAAIHHDRRPFILMPKLIGLKVSKRAMADAPENIVPFTDKQIKGMMADLPAFVAGMEKIGREIFPQYVATAERFRELGEKYYAPTQKRRGKPLLDPKIMWRIPRGFKLPHVQIKFKRLTKAERIALTSKVDSKRRLDSTPST